MLLSLKARKEMVEKALVASLPPKEDPPSPLIEAMHYSVLGSGKRLRPILLLESLNLFKSHVEEALPVASAVEFLHCYSLIHDDLPCMDDDDLRRGRPTLHKVYGEDIAVLAGDALLTLVFEILASTPLSPLLRLQLIQELSQASGHSGMVRGQVEDLLAEGEAIPIQGLYRIHAHKTGALITFSARAGALIGGATEEELSSLTQFGEAIGLLFQVTDDILDVVGETQVMGKTRGSDEGLHKATFPQILGLLESKKLAQALGDKARESLAIFGAKGKTLIEIAQYIQDRDR